ncbi:MAG: hypothetical protein HY334_04265 [Armatimonadetes bacterium]|nr:hypothetical protein [Armatimonadota bacterium]
MGFFGLARRPLRSSRALFVPLPPRGVRIRLRARERLAEVLDRELEFPE